MVAAMAGIRDDGLIDAHCAHLTYVGLRPGTIHQRRWHLGRLALWVAPHDLLDAPDELVKSFVARPELGAEAQNTALTHVRGFYRWALRAGLADADPTLDIVRPRRPRRLPRPMPEPDLARALAVAPEPIRTWILLGAFAGLRCCEIAPLRGEDFDGELLLIREQKGGDQDTVPVGPPLDARLAELPRRGLWFPRWDGQPGPISANQLQRHANRFLHSIEIADTMHTLRHRYITQVHEHGGHDVLLTQRLARHRTPASTAPYTRLSATRIRAAVANLPMPA